MVGIKVQMGADGIGKRHIRRPQHTFHLRNLPYQIQPFMIAPVLPGETMRSLMIQSRCVSDPLVNPLVGWWMEYYFFYVKHRDLNNRDNATEMMINPAFDIDTADAQAASIAHYHIGAGVSWVHQCLERVTEEYFRNEGETWDEYTLTTGTGALPIASIGRDQAIDSIITDTQEVAVDIDLTDAGSQAGVAVMASEIEAALQQWQFAKLNNLTDMTYEDYLKTYGIKGQSIEEPHKPELLRFIREWTYPTNTINPSDGAPSSAVSWAIADKADKDRFFPEPGFIFGVCVARPKVYLQRLNGNFADLMSNAMKWLPAVLENEPRVGRAAIAQGAGPVLLSTEDVVVDLRDLLMYGDQFVNFAPGGSDHSSVDLPTDAGTAGINKAYVDDGDVNALFVDSAGPLVLVRQDGVVNLQIATRQMDTTPRTASISA